MLCKKICIAKDGFIALKLAMHVCGKTWGFPLIRSIYNKDWIK